MTSLASPVSFLHCDGAIAMNADQHIEVDLGGPPLDQFVLPPPPTEALAIKACVRASLRLIGLDTDKRLGPLRILVPAYAAIWRAILSECDTALHLVGPTGWFKSEVAALMQQHFGAGMDARHFPASWEASPTYLADVMFRAKDVIVVIDDFKLRGSQRNIQDLHAKAEEVFQGAGNRAGRGRGRRDGGVRSPKPPRCLIVSTGELIPRGESCRARMVILEVSPHDIVKAMLSAFQKDARDGLYAAASAAFIAWLAQDGRIMGVWKQLSQEIADERTKLLEETDRAASAQRGGGDDERAAEMHRRTPQNVANLYVGLRYFLRFALECGAINSAEHDRLLKESWATLKDVAQAQARFLIGAEETSRYLELLASEIACGRAHLAGADGIWPANAIGCGWRQQGLVWVPQGRCVGWICEEGIFLEPVAAFRVVQDTIGASGEPLGLDERTLRRRLAQKDLIHVNGGTGDDDASRLTFRRDLAGIRKRTVIWLKRGTLPQDPADETARENSAEGPHARNGVRPVRPSEISDDLADQSFDFESETGAQS